MEAMMKTQTKKHEPKGKRGRPSIIKRTIEKRKTPTMTPKRTKTEPEHI